MIKLLIDQERCKACELCLTTCPQNALFLSDKFNSRGYRYIIFHEGKKCTGCALCAQVCPDMAISIYKDKKPVATKEQRHK